MKAINFLLGVLVLCITTLSSGQNPYPPINRSTVLDGETISQTQAPAENLQVLDNDSIVRLREAMANVDSMAPAIEPAFDSVTSVSVLDSTTAGVSSVASTDVDHGETKPHESEIGINQRFGLNGTLATWILIILGCGLVMLFRTNAVKSFGNTVKGWFTREDPLEREKRKAAIIKIRADSKADTIKVIGEAVGEAETKIGKEKIVWAGSGDLRNFIDWMLEGKRWFRWNWNLIMGSFLGFLLICTLALFAFKQPAKVIINNEIPVVVTPTVTAVVNPEPGGEVIIDHQPTDGTTPHSKVTTVVFDVPGANEDGFKPITADWTLPRNPDGWRTTVTWTGNPVWYPVADKYDQYIDMRAGKNVDIGDYNPEKTNFSFQSLDGQPARVTLQYWSKVGV